MSQYTEEEQAWINDMAAKHDGVNATPYYL